MATGDVEVNLTNVNAKAGAYFNGTSSNLALGVLPGLDSKPFSFSAWIYVKKRTGITNHTILHYGLDWGGDTGYLWVIDDQGTTGQQVLYYGTNTTYATSVIPTDQWVHVAVTNDGTTARFYTNGVADGTPAGNLKTDTSSNSYIGFENVNYMFGMIKDLRVYKDKILSLAEVNSIMNGETVTDGLVNQWKLENNYTDNVGGYDGTGTNTYLTIVDDAVSQAIAADYTTSGDNYILSAVAGSQIMSVIVEET